MFFVGVMGPKVTYLLFEANNLFPISGMLTCEKQKRIGYYQLTT